MLRGFIDLSVSPVQSIQCNVYSHLAPTAPRQPPPLPLPLNAYMAPPPPATQPVVQEAAAEVATKATVKVAAKAAAEAAAEVAAKAATEAAVEAAAVAAAETSTREVSVCGMCWSADTGAGKTPRTPPCPRVCHYRVACQAGAGSTSVP